MLAHLKMVLPQNEILAFVPIWTHHHILTIHIFILTLLFAFFVRNVETLMTILVKNKPSKMWRKHGLAPIWDTIVLNLSFFLPILWNPDMMMTYVAPTRMVRATMTASVKMTGMAIANWQPGEEARVKKRCLDSLWQRSSPRWWIYRVNLWRVMMKRSLLLWLVSFS